MDNGNKKRGRPPKAKDYNSPLAKRLRELCEGKTQQEIADEAGITRQNLGKFLSGETKPDVDTLEKLATYFNVSTDYLLGLTDNATTDTDLRAVCDYVGLSIECIKKIRLFIIMGFKHTLEKIFNSDEFFPCLVPCCLKIEMLGEDLQELLNSNEYKQYKENAIEFYKNQGRNDVVEILNAIEKNSSEVLESHDNEITLKKLVDEIKKSPEGLCNNLRSKIDLERYTIIKHTEKLMDIFDCRVNKE